MIVVRNDPDPSILWSTESRLGRAGANALVGEKPNRPKTLWSENTREESAIRSRDSDQWIDFQAFAAAR